MNEILLEKFNAEGQYHCDDGPAKIEILEYMLPGKNDECEAATWYQNGEKHREDGPAVESIAGSAWYQNGELHRVDGPAAYTNKEIWGELASNMWFVNGKGCSTNDAFQKAANLTDQEMSAIIAEHGNVGKR